MRRRALYRNSNSIPQNGLVSEWKLEETSGTTVFDSKGTHNLDNRQNTTLVDASTVSVAGQVGNAFDLGINNGNLYLPSFSEDFMIHTAGGLNKKFSISFWFQATQSISLRYFLRLKNGTTDTWQFYTGSNIPYFRVRQQNGTFMQLQFGTTNGAQGELSINSLNRYHIVLVCNPDLPDSQVLKAYVDGLPNLNSSTGTQQLFTRDVNSRFFIGTENINQSAKGIVDEIKYYSNKALTETEALSIYNTEK